MNIYNTTGGPISETESGVSQRTCITRARWETRTPLLRNEQNCKKVLMTADTVGGVWTYVCDLSISLAAQGVEVVVAAMGPPPTLDRVAALEGQKGITVLSRPFRLEWMPEPWDDVLAAREWIRELEQEHKPDIIHLNQFCTGHAGHEVPVLVVAHSCVFSWHKAVRGKSPGTEWDRYWIEVCRGLRLADGVTAVSAEMLSELNYHYSYFNELSQIPCGRFFSVPPVGRRRERILGVGRVWDEAKNFQLLDAIAPQLAWPVRVAGSWSVCNENAVAPFRNLELTGELNSAGVQNEFVSAEIFAAPALYEPFGLSILEAARAGCALLLADIPSLRENWSGVALFADPHDKQQWLNYLNYLCVNTSERREMGEMCRQRAQTKRFNPASMAEKYREHYQVLLYQNS